MLKFSLLFVAILLGLFFLELTPPGQQYFVQPWTAAVARVGAAGSSGVEAMIVLVAAMLAFPATLKQRLAGIAIGLVAILALNLGLVLGLSYLRQWDPQWFEWVRLYLWQALLMLGALFIWLLWIGMLADRRDLLAFMGRTLLALPVTLALWYFTAPFFDDVAGRIAKPAITLATGGKVTDYSFRQRQVRYSIEVHAPYKMYKRTQPPAIAELEVNASLYTSGMALFLALSVALKSSRRPGRIAAGCLVLVFVPAWGVAFDVLKQLGATPAMASYLEWAPELRETIALGYQVGALLLPTLAPVALWLGINREWLVPVAVPPGGHTVG